MPQLPVQAQQMLHALSMGPPHLHYSHPRFLSTGVLSQGTALSIASSLCHLWEPLGTLHGSPQLTAPGRSAVHAGAARGLGAALPQPCTTGIPDPPVSSALSTEPTRGKFYKLEETQVKAERAQS